MGDPPRGCGWCRGCGCAVHIKGWRAGEGLTCPWEPSRGPRAGGVAPRAACLWPKFGPGSRRPAPGGLLLRPSSPAARGGGPSSVSGAAAGTAKWAGPDPPPEDPLEKRERGGSVRQPRGQATGRRPWSSVLRSALLARVRDLPTLFCFSFEYATKPSGRVIFFLL